ncbi:MAG: head maturation protease, ClpP-related [Clostridium sp.]
MNGLRKNNIIQNKYLKVVNKSMSKILNLKGMDYKTGEIKDSGSLEIKNQTENSADLYFYGDIVSESWLSEWYEDDMCPGDVKKFLDELENTKNINIHINSGGGSVFGGLAIYNQLKRYNATITTYIDGLAASIASIIAMAGDKIVMPENAMLMVHKPLTWCSGNADDLKKQIEILDTCQKSIVSIYMKKVKPGITEEEINGLVNESTWLTGEEAAKYFNIELEGSINIENCISNYFEQYKIPENKAISIDKNSKMAFFNTNNHINRPKNEIPIMDEATKIMIERIKNL